MISIIGLGNAASAIAQLFSDIAQYNVFKLNSSIQRNTKYNFKLKKFEKPEEYEDNIPDLKKFFSNVTDKVQFIVVGGSFSSNYSLGILEQLKDKKVDIIYVQPDTELLTGYPVLVENVTFGVLQEYTRSGLFNSITLFSNLDQSPFILNFIQFLRITCKLRLSISIHFSPYFLLVLYLLRTKLILSGGFPNTR